MSDPFFICHNYTRAYAHLLAPNYGGNKQYDKR